MTRQFDSAYDQSFASATRRLLQALREAGHTVETPVTGAVIVNGVTIRPDCWDHLAMEFDGDNLDEIMETIRSLG